MEHTFNLDQNQVKLSKIDNRLVIEIEADPSGRSFSLELDNDVIAQVSNEIFADTEDMKNGLIEALKKIYKEVSITFDGDGKLLYRLSLSVGSIRKELQFTLSLQEKKLSQTSLLEKKVESLQKVVENFERKQEKLEKDNERISAGNNRIIKFMNKLEMIVFEKLDAFEKRIASLEGKNGPPPSQKLESENGLWQSFNPNLLQSSGFIFSNSNKTIQYQDEKCELPILNSLPPKGKTIFSIKIEKMKTSIWIGLASISNLFQYNWHKSDLRFLVSSGKVEYNQITFNHKLVNNYQFKEGDIVSMVVDNDKRRVAFFVNNTDVNSLEVDLLENTPCFPYIGFFDVEDKATFVSAQFEK